ncbi:MAG TPA: hypothetical protein VJB15_08175, partial [Rhodothermia bacterium]|nr:hypothetical protein [Rhodothermia bacterium]
TICGRFEPVRMARTLLTFRRCRIVAMAALLAWLPYTSVWCAENPFGNVGCPILPASAHAGHHHENAAGAPAHSTHDDHGPARSCCQLTGKCGINVTSAQGPDLTPAIVTASAIYPVEASLAQSPFVASSRIDATHGPPIYLQHLTLLI